MAAFSRIRCAVSAKNSFDTRRLRSLRSKNIPGGMRLMQRLVHAWGVSSVVEGDEENYTVTPRHYAVRQA
jgi:hypothetical protein